MKTKIFIIALLGMFIMTGCNNSKPKQEDDPVDTKEFDETSIIFKAPLISDQHLGYKDSSVDNEKRLDYDLKTLKNIYGKDFDCVLSCGDHTQDGKKEQVQAFMKIYKENFSLDKTPFVFAHGNHDTYWSGCMTTTEFYDAYGPEVYKNDLDQTQAKLGNRHVKINGIDIVALQVKTFMPDYNDFTDATMDWFDITMHAISQTNPNMPVIVLCHSPALNTIYGSLESDDCGTWGASKQLNVMLKDYPNALLCSGHTHYGITDERNIMQTDFTSIGAGSTCDLDLDTNFEGVSELPNSRSYSFGSIIEIDKNGNTRVTRYDLIKKERIKKPWIIPSPKEDKSHLQKYSFNYRKENLKAPVFPSNGKLVVSEDGTKTKLAFDAFETDDIVFKYEIRFFVEPNIADIEDYAVNYFIMNDWYNYTNPQTGKVELKLAVKYNNKFTYALLAYNSFDSYGVAIES